MEPAVELAYPQGTVTPQQAGEEETKGEEEVPSAAGQGLCDRVSGWTRWQLLDALHDAFTVSSSLVDVVTDVLVTIEFWQHGHYLFAWCSLAIFGLAQLSYAFLFTSTWAGNHSNCGKVAVFFGVLPLGQLIPVFVWVESLRLPALDRCLTRMGFSPTARSKEREVSTAAGADAIVDQVEDTDSLWSYIQSKYSSHAGFLAEAFIEAIPQGVLQTAAIISLRDATNLNILSILISVSVVASKGYLVSYSINRPSFAFNYLCIAADAFNLFATATWLFTIGVDDPTTRAWWLLAMAGMALCAVGGLHVLLFSMFDDHLKLLEPNKYTTFKVPSVLFNIYLVRLLAWCLAVIPVSVVFLSAKLSLLPIALFGSLDPEHAQRAHFYGPLFHFLGGDVTAPDRFEVCDQGLPGLRCEHGRCVRQAEARTADCDLRLQCANRFFLEARRNRSSLEQSLAHPKWRRAKWQGSTRVPVTAAQAAQAAAEDWVAKLNLSRSTRNKPDKTHVPNDRWSKIAEDANSAAEERRRMRMENLKEAAGTGVTELDNELEARSEVLVRATSCSKFWAHLQKELRARPAAGLLRLAAVLTLVVVALAAAAWVPVTVAFTAYSSVFSVLHVAKCGESEYFFPCVLSTCYLACLVGMLVLVPAVWRFQLMRADVVNIKGFPDIFYSPWLLKDVYRCYRVAQVRDQLVWALRNRLGYYNAIEVLEFLDENPSATGAAAYV